MREIFLLCSLFVFFSRELQKPAAIHASRIEYPLKNCNENSDETSPNCPGSSPPEGSCPPNNYQCKSGRCIRLENACDGEIDCEDRSDETVELCPSTFCPSFSFRCAYGACISGNKKCDGTKNCAGGSDEINSLCGNETITIPTRDPGAEGGCTFDALPNVIAHYNLNPNDFSTITYSCYPNHMLVGPTDNFCDNGKWRNMHPTCQPTRFCDNEIIKGVSFQALCEYAGIIIPYHESPLLPGTRAKISCQFGYQKPNIPVQEVIACDEDGIWDYFPFTCEQVCGVVPDISTPFMLGDSRINNTFVPWHVGIYSQETGKYKQICGGTIINAKVGISAAHCFWNVREDRLHDKALFSVYAGKYYRDYYHTKEPLPTQVLLIEDLFVPSEYKDVHLLYESDIAVVVLTEFIVLRPHIKPICIEWQSYNNKIIRSNLSGRVAGWGKADDNQPSEELKAIDLPTVRYEQCKEQVEPRYKILVTRDKFCIKGLAGEAVCAGDSGGGFAVPKTINGQNVFYLWGIVSNGLTDKSKCTGDYFTLFTNIQFYQYMIIDYETRNRPH